MHIWIDHAESESEFQVEKAQWVFGGPQASSCEDANIVMIKASLGASNHHPWIFVYLYVLIMILGCALGYRS
jgi:hypothetical protein